MTQLLAEYWILLIIALLIGLLVAWFLFRTTRRATVTDARSGDVLDEGAAPAQRNAALVNAPPAAGVSPETTSNRAPEPQTMPKTAPAAAAAFPAGNGGDDLTRLKGVGPKLAAMLQEQGITDFAQIAAWSDEDVSRIDATLGRFQGRIQRDDWRGQADLLVRGDSEAFNRKYGAQ